MTERLGDIDLLIVDDDMVLDAIGIPQLITGRACIVQDIRHMIRDKGYLVQIVAERDKKRRATVFAHIENEIEADTRIRPGTARVSELQFDRYLVSAISLVYGPLELELLGV